MQMYSTEEQKILEFKIKEMSKHNKWNFALWHEF